MIGRLCCQPLSYSKKVPEGRKERLTLLSSWLGSEAGSVLGQRTELRCKRDDIIDALVALWTAERILRGVAVSLPANPPYDELGIPMEISA
jgi:predicted RNase H-like nuclease